MLGQLLDHIRDYYVSRFIDAINEHASADGVTLTHEPAFCDANGNVVTERELARPSRGDLLVIHDGAVSDSVQIDTDEMLSFEPIAGVIDLCNRLTEHQAFGHVVTDGQQIKMASLPSGGDAAMNGSLLVASAIGCYGAGDKWHVVVLVAAMAYISTLLAVHFLVGNSAPIVRVTRR